VARWLRYDAKGYTPDMAISIRSYDETSDIGEVRLCEEMKVLRDKLLLLQDRCSRLNADCMTVVPMTRRNALARDGKKSNTLCKQTKDDYI